MMVLVSVKELAMKLGISPKSVYRAYRNREIPASQFRRMLMFDVDKVRRAMEQRAELMPYKRCTKDRSAIGGDSRRRARTMSPRSVKRGRNFQKSTRRRA